VGALVGGVFGALVLGAFIELGLMLDSRVANVIPVIVLTAAGAYAGWLLGVVIFGAVRGAKETEEEP
jgi:hypothetical protein